MVGLTTFPELPTTALAIACLVRVCLFRGCALMTCLHDQRRQPAAYVFVQAYQQIWPGNGHPDSNNSSDYLTHTELASPLNRLSAGRIRRPPRGCASPLTRGYFVGWASHTSVTADACQRRLLLVIQQVPTNMLAHDAEQGSSELHALCDYSSTAQSPEAGSPRPRAVHHCRKAAAAPCGHLPVIHRPSEDGFGSRISTRPVRTVTLCGVAVPWINWVLHPVETVLVIGDNNLTMADTWSASKRLVSH